MDSDPSEVAVGWRGLTDAGHKIVFASPNGLQARCDELMTTGEGLDPWGRIPGLRRLPVIGRRLRGSSAARAAHESLLHDPAWCSPKSWDAVTLDDFEAVLLPGGHRARGMRAYLESPALQALVVDAFWRDLPVAAVCHRGLLGARRLAA